MNKLTKLLSVFALAGAIGAGVAGAAGCAHKHTYEDKWTSGGADGHYHVATCHEDQHDAIKPHTWDDDKDTTCNDCGYTRTVTPSGPDNPGGPQNPGPDNPGPSTGDKLKVPADAVALMVEGVGDEEVQLSAAKKSHAIDKTGIKVYFGTGDRSNPTKSTEVPADNLDLKLVDPKEQTCSSWEGLKMNGDYTLTAKLKNAVDSEGNALDENDYVGTILVKVINKATEIALKEGATTTQAQSVVDGMTSTWTYEITRENEDKEDVAAKNVTIGRIDHVHTGERSAAITTKVEGVEVKGTVNYTISATDGAIVQSYAMRAADLADKVSGNDGIQKADVVLQDGRFTVQVTKGGVDDHGNEYDGKYFAKRLKYGGHVLSDNSKMYVKIHVDAAALITVYAYVNNGTAGKGEANRYLSIYDGITYQDGEKKAQLGNIIGDKQNTLQKEDTRHTFNVPEAGDYYLVCESGDVCLTYIQVDQIVTTGEAVDLGGNAAPSALEINTSAAVKKYKKDETVSFAGITGSITYANEVTLDSTKVELANTDLTFPASVDTSKLGPQDITVEYTPQGGSKLTAKYSITVESAVAGVWGATAKLSSDVNTVLPKDSAADAAVTVKLSDLEAAIVGNSTTATATVTAATYKAADAEGDGTAITAEGVGITKGKYVITATVKVADGDDEATFEATIALNIVVDGEKNDIVVDLGSKVATGAQTTGNYVLYSDDDETVVTLRSGNKTDQPVEAASATYEEGNCTGTVKFNGKLQAQSSAAIRCVDITVTGTCKIVVYGYSTKDVTMVGVADTVTKYDDVSSDLDSKTLVHTSVNGATGTANTAANAVKMEYVVKASDLKDGKFTLRVGFSDSGSYLSYIGIEYSYAG